MMRAMTLRGKLYMAAKFRKAAARTHEQVSEIRPLLTIAENRRGLDGIGNIIRDWEGTATRSFELYAARQAGQALELIRVHTDGAIRSIETSAAAIISAERAALAGESSMGFAVFADEVRNLAQRRAKAAHETTGLIEETVPRAGEGQQRLAELPQSLTQLTPAARTTRERLNEVRRASREPTRGLGLIGSAMSRLEHLTQQVAAGAEQCAAASQELASQAASMTPVVDGLRRMAG